MNNNVNDQVNGGIFMKELIIKIVLLVMMLGTISLTGCSSRKDTVKKIEKRNPTEVMTELENTVKKSDYEAFKKLFIFSTGDKYTKEDFESLKKFMESKKKSNIYYAYSYDDRSVAVFEMDNIGEKYYISGFTKMPRSLYYHIMGIVEPKPIESNNPVKGEISLILAATEYISKITWSPDESCVAFIRMDMMNECAQIYLWKVGANKPVLIKGVEECFGNFSWSPDSKCVIADTGTYVTRSGYLISAKDSRLIKEFGFVGPVCWSPDSKMFVAACVSKVTPNSSYDFVYDLAVFDSQTGNQDIVKYASGDYYLNAQKWNEDGTIIYEKIYLDTNEKETLSYKYK